MALLIKRNGMLADLSALTERSASAFISPDLKIKRNGALISAFAPTVRRKAQIIGAPIANTPLLVERALFWGLGVTAHLDTYINGVLAQSGGIYTPSAGDVTKSIYVIDVGVNTWGSIPAISGSRVCVAALDVPALLDGYDGPLSNYVISGNTNPLLETSGQVQGTGRVRLTGTGNGVATTMTITRTLSNIDPATLGVLAYCGSRTSASVTSGTGLNLARGAPNNTIAQSDSAAKFKSGNHWFSQNISEFTAVVGLGLGTLAIKPSIQQVAPYTSPADGTVDALFSNAGGRGTLVLTDDDFTASAFLELYPLLKARDFPATFFLPGGQVGAPGKSTWPQAREMEAGGMEFGPNTMFDVAATTFASPALYAADLALCKALMLANGLSDRALQIMALSNGIWTDAHIAALVADGMLMARTTEPQCLHTRFGFGDQAMTMPSFSITGTVTLAAAIAQVELAITRGATQIVHTHDISDSPTNNGWHKTLKMIPFLDWAITQRALGRLDILSMSQLRARDAAAAVPA